MLARIKQHFQSTNPFSMNRSTNKIKSQYITAPVQPEVTDACGHVINEPIDAVYTWVNGSEPDFIEALEHILGKCTKVTEL